MVKLSIFHCHSCIADIIFSFTKNIPSVDDVMLMDGVVLQIDNDDIIIS